MLVAGFALLVYVHQIDRLVGEGNLLQERLQFSQAADIYRQALTLANRTGPDTQYRALALHNLATSEYRQGQYADAQRNYLEAIRIWEKRGHENLASVLTNYAELCHARGNDREALEYSTRALALNERAAASLQNGLTIHGNILRSLGRFQEARQTLERAVAMGAAQSSTPRQAFALTSLAQTNLNNGRFEESRAAAQQAAEIWASLNGREHIQYANAMALLARIARAEGDFVLAEQKTRQALGIFERTLGGNHPRLVAALADLADMLGRRRRFEDAQRLLLRAEELARISLGERHPDYAAVLLALADQYRLASQQASAEPYYKRALAIAEAVHGASNIQLASYLNNYATALFELGQKAEAEQLYRRVLATREAALGRLHIDNAETLLNLSVICADAARYDEAKAFIERSLAIRQHFFGDSHPSLVPALNTYAHILKSVGDKKRAKEVSSMAQMIMASQPESQHTVDVKTLRTFR